MVHVTECRFPWPMGVTSQNPAIILSTYAHQDLGVGLKYGLMQILTQSRAANAINGHPCRLNRSLNSIQNFQEMQGRK
jgi:hypothetical protein